MQSVAVLFICFRLCLWMLITITIPTSQSLDVWCSDLMITYFTHFLLLHDHFTHFLLLHDHFTHFLLLHDHFTHFLLLHNNLFHPLLTPSPSWMSRLNHSSVYWVSQSSFDIRFVCNWSLLLIVVSAVLWILFFMGQLYLLPEMSQIYVNHFLKTSTLCFLYSVCYCGSLICRFHLNPLMVENCC